MSRRTDPKSHLTDFIRRLGYQGRRGSQSTQAGEESGFNDGSGRYALDFPGPVVLANAPTRGQSFLPRRRVVSTSKNIDDDYEEGQNEEMPPLDDDNNVQDPSHKHPRSGFDSEEEERDVMGDAEKRLHQRQRRQRQQQRSGGVGPHGGDGLENSPSPRGSAPSESSVCDAFDDSVSGRTTSRVSAIQRRGRGRGRAGAGGGSSRGALPSKTNTHTRAHESM